MTPLRRELHAFLDRLVDAIESAPLEEYVDQKTSPLGRERHCALVRSGKLKGVKDGRRILVRRTDIEAYLARRTVVKADPENDIDREAARIVSDYSKRSA